MVSRDGLKALTNGNMKIHKVLALPPSLEEDAIYFVKNGTGADLYIVSNEGVATKVSSGVDYGLTLGEEGDTAYRGDRGKFAYDHAESPHVETKTDIGLGHVNNTSDLDKPISDDTQAALDTKAEPITVAEVAPVSPEEGDMWFDTVIGQLYAYYTDGDSGQWVSVNSSAFNSTLTTDQAAVLSYLSYDAVNEKIIASKAIETTLNSLFLGEQHKMSSGAENIFFTNLGNNTNFYPMWGGLKDQSLTENQGSDGYIPPSGRVYTDMFSTTLGGNPVPASSIGYSGGNFFGVSIAGLGITTVAAEEINLDNVKLEYRLSIAGRPVYKQVLPQTGLITADSTVEWYFDHPVEIHAGTTIFAEIRKVSRADDSDMGVFQVRVGDTNDPTTGIPRYQTIVHNRLFEDKDLELISPYQKYKAADFGLDDTGSTILLRDLSLGADNLLQPYAVNTLEAVAVGTEIQIKIKDGAKIIIESLPVNAASVDGTFVNAVLNQAVTQLNNLFTATDTYVSTDTHVTGFSLVSDDLTLTLNDGTSYTTDVTTLGVDTNNFVSSGTLSGSDLVLTMDDATTVTIDASGLDVDTNDVVQSGTVNGDDLELTLSNSTVITIDVSSLAVDNTLYVSSGVLSGTDLVLTMSDASTVTIDASSLAIDEDTTITGGQVSGTDIILSLSDSSTITVDASTLGGAGSSGNPVVSGSVVGSDLILVLDDASTITIDATNMVNGSNLSAIGQNWYVSYGTNAGDEITGPTSNAFSAANHPLYYGEKLAVGEEFSWTQYHMVTNASYFMSIGVWDGATDGTGTSTATSITNWSTKFGFYSNTLTEDTSTLVNGVYSSKNTNIGTGVTYTNGAIMRLVYGSDFRLRLYVDGLHVVTTTTPETGGDLDIQVASSNNGVEFPDFIKSATEWNILHDFNSSETGASDGIEDDTVIESGFSISPGEKVMMDLSYDGRNSRIGFGYTGAATGNTNSYNDVVDSLIYGSSEQIIQQTAGTWDFNTSATYYVNSGSGKWTVGNGVHAGIVSLRYQSDYSVDLYSETYGEVIATKVADLDGSSFNLTVGASSNLDYEYLPGISKQTIGQSFQPVITYAPVASDQSVTVTEAEVLNYQIVTSGYIVNQYVAENAPSWMTINQSTGVLSGTAPAFAGTSADTIVVNCKAGNAVGGATNFTVTVTVAEITYTNTKSLSFPSSGNGYLTGSASSVSTLQRAANGSGASDAWSISMWVKPGTSSLSQQLFHYGGNTAYSTGAISLSQQNATDLVFLYGSASNNIYCAKSGALTSNAWNHILITYDGGTTGAASGSVSNYFSRFKMVVNGVDQNPTFSHTNYGYTGSVPANNYFIGRGIGAAWKLTSAVLNQVAIWDNDQFANRAAIYNSGAAQDLSQLGAPPAHYYEIENSVSTISDISGSAALSGYNFTSSDLVTDTP